MERKYRMIRVAAGDYLLPANDGETIWRIMRYVDGPSYGIADWARDRALWGAWRWLGTWDELGKVDPESDEWSPWSGDRWTMEVSTFDTRREAIDAALEIT